MRDPLTRETEKLIESLDVWSAGGIVATQTPFAEGACRVPRLAEDVGQSRDAGGEGNLLALADIEVVTDGGATGVEASHQHRARRRADRAAAIVSSQYETLLGETVEVWGQDFLLTHEAHFAVAQVVG